MRAAFESGGVVQSRTIEIVVLVPVVVAFAVVVALDGAVATLRHVPERRS